MGRGMMCLEDMDIVATKVALASIAKEVFVKNEDIADIILVRRESLTAFKAKYIFSVKVKHDENASQKLYSLFMKNYTLTQSFYPVKTQTIVENSLLKELFFIEVIAKV